MNKILDIDIESIPIITDIICVNRFHSNYNENHSALEIDLNLTEFENNDLGLINSTSIGENFSFLI